MNEDLKGILENVKNGTVSVEDAVLELRKAPYADIDYAIKKIKSVNEFLMQQTDEKFSFEETVEMMENLFID